MKAKAALFILCVILLSCKKGSNPPITLDGTLTECAANNSCSYDYYDNADFINAKSLISGYYRVFLYNSTNNNVCNATSQIIFKTSLSNSEFDINSNQITSGQVVANNMICPCCDYDLLLKPIGGEIKGKKTDSNHWLVNASIVFGTFVNNPVDTLTVNQYFTLEKLQ